MIVNKNPCHVDIRRKPGYMQWEIYLVEEIDKDHIGVAQPTEITFLTQSKYDAIKPTFEVSANPEMENWFTAFTDATFNAFPYLRDKYATKRNEEELFALKDHIRNLNEIIKSLNPNTDIRGKVKE